jgi:hypothetical protein
VAVDAQERDLVVLHLAFAVIAVAALALPGPVAQGWRLWGLLVGYDLATLAVVWWRGHRRWLRIWWFAAVTSVFQVVPDAVLAAGLGTLRFPPDGAPALGPVTASMALMWTVPLVLIASAADAAARRRGSTAGWMVAVGAAAAVFVGAEALLPPLGIWEPVGVTTIGGWLAPYVLPPELLLGPPRGGASRPPATGTRCWPCRWVRSSASSTPVRSRPAGCCWSGGCSPDGPVGRRDGRR